MIGYHPLTESVDAYKSNEIHELTKQMHISRYQWCGERFNLGNFSIDAACGRGYGTEILTRFSPFVLGVDLSEEALAYAGREHANNRLRYLQADLASDKLGEEVRCNGYRHPSSIVSFETLEHCDDPEKVLFNFFGLLSPQGLFLISVPNGAVEKKNTHGQPKNEYHIHSFTLDEVARLVRNTGFEGLQFYGQAPIYGGVKGFLRKVETYIKSNGAKSNSEKEGKKKESSKLSDFVRTARWSLDNLLNISGALSKPRDFLVETSENLIVVARKG